MYAIRVRSIQFAIYGKVQMIGHLLNWMHVHMYNWYIKYVLVHKRIIWKKCLSVHQSLMCYLLATFFSCILHQNHLKSCSNLTAILGQNGWEFKSLKQTIHLTAEKKDIE